MSLKIAIPRDVPGQEKFSGEVPSEERKVRKTVHKEAAGILAELLQKGATEEFSGSDSEGSRTPSPRQSPNFGGASANTQAGGSSTAKRESTPELFGKGMDLLVSRLRMAVDAFASKVLQANSSDALEFTQEDNKKYVESLNGLARAILFHSAAQKAFAWALYWREMSGSSEGLPERHPLKYFEKVLQELHAEYFGPSRDSYLTFCAKLSAENLVGGELLDVENVFSPHARGEMALMDQPNRTSARPRAGDKLSLYAAALGAEAISTALGEKGGQKLGGGESTAFQSFLSQDATKNEEVLASLRRAQEGNVEDVKEMEAVLTSFRRALIDITEDKDSLGLLESAQGSPSLRV